jgi:transcriptional regulator with XRE-family HTH domain
MNRLSGHDVAEAMRSLAQAITSLEHAAQHCLSPSPEIAYALAGALASSEQAGAFLLDAKDAMRVHLNSRMEHHNAN